MAIEDTKKDLEYLTRLIDNLGEKINLNFNMAGLDAAKVTISQIEEKVDLLNTSLESTGKLDRERLKTQEKILSNLNQYLILAKKDPSTSPEQIKALEKQITQAEKKLGYMKDSENSARKLLDTSLGLNKNNESILQKRRDMLNLSKLQMPQEEAALKLQQLKEVTITKIVEKIAQYGKAMLEVSAQLEKSTVDLARQGGFSIDFARNSILELGSSLSMAGVTAEQAGKNLVTLKDSYTGFTNLSEESQTSFALTVSLLDRLGVSANASAKFSDMATKSLGLSQAQNQKFLMSLKNFSDTTNISMQQLSKNLEGSTDSLANYGTKGLQVFQDMSLAAKNLGIEMNKLLSVTEKFTTFEGAADAAGKLNAALGGDFINSVDLLTASMEDPVEALKILKQGMDQSGKSFKELDVGMQRVVASSIGMSVAEAGKMFSQDINTATASMRSQQMTQEKLAEMTEKLTSFTDKLKGAFVNLYPLLEPIIKKLTDFADWLGKVTKQFREYLKENPGVKEALSNFALGITAIAVAIGVLAPFFAAYTAIKSFFILRTLAATAATVADTTANIANSASKMANAGANTAQAASEAAKTATIQADTVATTVNTAATNSSTGANNAKTASLLKMAFAFALVGVGIYAATTGLSNLVEAFKGMTAEEFGMLAISVIGLGVGFYFLATASAVSVKPLLLAAAALVLIGFGFLEIGAGISLVIGAFSLIISSVAMVIEQIRLMNESNVDLVNAMLKIGDSTISNYEALVDVFSSLADEMERISATGVIQGLSKPINVANVQGISTSELTQTEQKMQGQSAQGKQEIVVNLKVDSPIQIDKDVIGKYAAQAQQKFTYDARNPGLVPAFNYSTSIG